MSSKNKNKGGNGNGNSNQNSAATTSVPVPDPISEKSISDEYNESFAKPVKEGTRTIDVVRIRKSNYNVGYGFLKSFFMQIGERMIAEGRKTFCSENDHFITISETVNE